jgi:hypothetical protein
MRKSISQFLVILFLAASMSARTEAQDIPLFAQFGRTNLEEIMAIIDAVMSESDRNPETKVLFKVNGGNENCFTCYYSRGSLITAYLKNSRKISSDKYLIQYCNDEKEGLLTQLYLLPKHAKLPDCNKTLKIPQNATLFDKIYFENNDNKLFALEDIYVDVIASSHGEYSRNALKAVKDILDKSPESKIYILVYLGTNKEEIHEDKNGTSTEKTIRNSDKKSLAKEMFLNAKKELIKNGVKPLQIEKVNGGYIDGKRELQFWFVPKGGESPKPKPDYFPKKSRKTKANKFW